MPLGALVVAVTLLLVAESRDPDPRRGNDFAGAVLSVIGFGAIVFGLVEGRNYGWFGAISSVAVGALSPVPLAFVVGALALILFVVLERRRNAAGRPVLLNLALLRIPSFRNGNLVAAIVSLGEFGLLFALPLWVQNVLGYSAFRTGLILLPLAAGSFAASGFGAPLAAARGPIFTVRLGILLELIGVAGLGAVASAGTRWWEIAPGLLVYGLGVGLATAQITGVVLADVPVAMSGQASGTQSTTRQLGSALGVAVLGTVLFSSLAGGLDHRLRDQPAALRTGVVAAVRDSAGAAIPGLAARPGGAPIADQARQAFAEATRWTAFTAAGFLLIGLLASVRLGSGRRDAHRPASSGSAPSGPAPSGPAPSGPAPSGPAPSGRASDGPDLDGPGETAAETPIGAG